MEENNQCREEDKYQQIMKYGNEKMKGKTLCGVEKY